MQPAYPYKEVAGIFCSDIHISDKAPPARSAEPDWHAAMKRPIDEVKALATYYNVPIFIAGDVCDRASLNARTVNWAIDNLFQAQAIPGNHELPMHRYDKKEEAAYWTLCEAGVLTDLVPDKTHEYADFGIRAFPYGYELKPCTESWHEFYFYVALAHKFVWTKDSGFPGAPLEGRVGKIRAELQGFTAAFFGDNHHGFYVPHTTNIFNCGTLFRRTRKEMQYRPRVGVLHKSGIVTEHFLDTSKDKYFDLQQLAILPQAEASDGRLAAVCAELATMGETSCDFRAAVRQQAAQPDVPKGVRNRVLEALEQQK